MARSYGHSLVPEFASCHHSLSVWPFDQVNIASTSIPPCAHLSDLVVILVTAPLAVKGSSMIVMTIPLITRVFSSMTIIPTITRYVVRWSCVSAGSWAPLVVQLRAGDRVRVCCASYRVVA